MNIPEWLRRARAVLVKKLLSASTFEERSAVVDEIRLFAGVHRSPKFMAHSPNAKEIEDKEIAIASSRRQLAEACNRLEAANIECGAAQARISALQSRRQQLLLDQQTLPARVAEQVAALGFARNNI